MSTEKSVWAVRGATTVERDDAESIVAATEQLIGDILDKNDLSVEDVISVVFTSTPDLVSEFPAAAARRIGLAEVPLMCATEIAVPGAVARCVRVLMHVRTARARGDLKHVYLGGARSLRTDLSE
jgi:monofunctional chorismate mutase